MWLRQRKSILTSIWKKSWSCRSNRWLKRVREWRRKLLKRGKLYHYGLSAARSSLTITLQFRVIMTATKNILSYLHPSVPTRKSTKSLTNHTVQPPSTTIPTTQNQKLHLPPSKKTKPVFFSAMTHPQVATCSKSGSRQNLLKEKAKKWKMTKNKLAIDRWSSN